MTVLFFPNYERCLISIWIYIPVSYTREIINTGYRNMTHRCHIVVRTVKVTFPRNLRSAQCISSTNLTDQFILQAGWNDFHVFSPLKDSLCGTTMSVCMICEQLSVIGFASPLLEWINLLIIGGSALCWMEIVWRSDCSYHCMTCEYRIFASCIFCFSPALDGIMDLDT